MGLIKSLRSFLVDPNTHSQTFGKYEQLDDADFFEFNKQVRQLQETGQIRVEQFDQSSVSRTLTKLAAFKHPTVEVDGLRDTDDRPKAVQKTPWRVSLDAMKRRIKSVEYIFPKSIPHMTIAVIILDNGYALVGESAPADAANFNEQLGKDYAYENALKKMWPLEAYVMRDLLSGNIELNNPNERWGS